MSLANSCRRVWVMLGHLRTEDEVEHGGSKR